MMIEFDPVEHVYTRAGKRVPSVTQVLGFLEDWDRVPRDLLDAAAEFGTHVHEAAALLVRDELDWSSLDPSLVPPLESLMAFLRESGAVVVESEKRLYHPVMRYAGTLDAVVHWKGGLAVLDWKTGQTVPKSVGAQCAAYAAALEAMGGPKIKRRYCVQLLADKYRVTKLEDPNDWNVFQSCRNVFRAKHGY
jgi:hypothetical protein